MDPLRRVPPQAVSVDAIKEDRSTHLEHVCPPPADSANVPLPFFPFAALLVVETETFGSHIRIKGKESEHYICMNDKGKIVGRVSIFLERESGGG